MRNLKFKFLLPVAAFMLAIAAAFASQTEEQVESALVQGYIYQTIPVVLSVRTVAADRFLVRMDQRLVPYPYL